MLSWTRLPALRPWVLVIVSVALALAFGCTRRDTAYPFRAPLVSSVRADDRPARAAGEPASTEERPRTRDMAALPAPHRESRDRRSQAEVRREPTRAETSAPHLGVADVARSRMASGVGVAESLRAMVGERDRDHTHLQFAMNALAAIGVSLAPEVRELATGAELLALAADRDAVEKRAPLAGDLVVFDRMDGETPASLIGVVVGRPERAHPTVEFVYLARGVVRRGYVTPATPTRQRDEQGRALNTFVRHLSSKDKKSDPFLAGQLFHGYIRVDRLPQ